MVRIRTVYIIKNYLAPISNHILLEQNSECYKQKKCGWFILTNFVASCIGGVTNSNVVLQHSKKKG